MPTGVFPMPDSEVRAAKLWPRPGVLGAGDLAWKVQSDLSIAVDTGDGDATYSHSASGITQFAPDSVTLGVGVELIAYSAWDGSAGEWWVLYDGPGAPFGGYLVSGTGYRSSVSVEARAVGAVLYQMETGGLHRLRWTKVEIYVNGSLDVTLPVSGIDATSAGVGPAYVPLCGIPLRVSHSCSAGRTNLTPWSYDPCDPDNAGGRDYETAVEQSVSGGWRARETSGSGAWVDYPVTPYGGDAPGGGPFALDLTGVLATRTWGDLLAGEASAKHLYSYVGREGVEQDVYATCPASLDPPSPETTVYVGRYSAKGIDPCGGGVADAYADVYRTEDESASAAGAVTLWPDLSQGLNRFAAQFAKMLYRADLPETRASLSTSWEDTEGAVTSSGSDSDTPTVHPNMAELLGLLRDADHPVLDLFDYSAYAPTSFSRSRTRSVTFGRGGTTSFLCPPPAAPDPCPTGALSWSCTAIYAPHDAIYQTETSSLSFPSYVGSVANYQGHALTVPRYLGTWGAAGWHLYDWREDWELQGSPAPWAPTEDGPGYWGPIRTQYAYNAALPSDERPRTRLDMIGSPYYDTAYTPFQNEFTGGLPWPGIARWVTREVDWKTSITLTEESEPMLSSPNESCSVAVSGSVIALTPSAGTITLDVDLVRADCYPYYALLAALSVSFPTWSNVASVTASVRSALGGSARLNGGSPLATSTAYPLPLGRDLGYAGTWGSDSGAGYVSDEGTDVPSGGQSADVMANPETVAGFQAVGARQGSVLRLNIVPADPGSDVTLGWPTFARPTTHPVVRWLNGNKAVLMWPDGPGILWGTHTTYVPDVGLHWPWIPKGLGEPNTLADALQWIYAIGEATDPGDVAAFDAEVNGWYDDFEVSLQNVGSADKHSFALLLPKGEGETIRFALVQTLAEPPPLPCWPVRARGTDDWAADGDPTTVRWDQAQEVKCLVTPGDTPIVLQEPDGTPISTAAAAPSGHSIQSYTLALTGDESDDYRVTKGGRTYARLYPWHGWYGVIGRKGWGDNWLLYTPWAQLHVLGWRIESEEARWRRSPGVVPPFETDVTLAEGADDREFRAAYVPGQLAAMAMAFARDGEGVWTATTFDDGEAFGGMSMLIENAIHPTVCALPYGPVIVAAMRPDDGESGPGEIVAKVGWIEDSTWSSEIVLTSGGTPIRVEDDTFHIAPAPELAGRLMLVARKEGDSGPTIWYSADDAPGQTTMTFTEAP
jgi:hypothetical protein